MAEPLPPSVAADFGLDPIVRDRIVIPPDSVDILANPYHYSEGSEFSGVGGVVQPPPHNPTAKERRMAVMFIDPTDPGTETGSVQPPELEGDFLS
jgi:hypothetical protein